MIGLTQPLVFQEIFSQPFLFLTITADMTLEELKQTSEIPTESKYVDILNLGEKEQTSTTC